MLRTYKKNTFLLLICLPHLISSMQLSTKELGTPAETTHDAINADMRLKKDPTWEQDILLYTPALSDSKTMQAYLLSLGFQKVTTTTTKDGLKLTGLFFKPENGTEVWLGAAGFQPGKKEGMAPLHSHLNNHPNRKNKIGLLLYDGRGSGESDGHALDKFDEYGYHHHHDIAAWIEFINAQEWVENNQPAQPKIIIYGTCAGAFHGDIYLSKRGEKARKEDNVIGFINESGWAEPGHIAFGSILFATKKQIADAITKFFVPTKKTVKKSYEEKIEQFTRDAKESNEKRKRSLKSLDWKDVEERFNHKVASMPPLQHVLIKGSTAIILPIVKTFLWYYNSIKRSEEHRVTTDLLREGNTTLLKKTLPTVRLHAISDTVAPLENVVEMHAKETNSSVEQLSLCDHSMLLIQRPYRTHNALMAAREHFLRLDKERTKALLESSSKEKDTMDESSSSESYDDSDSDE